MSNNNNWRIWRAKNDVIVQWFWILIINCRPKLKEGTFNLIVIIQFIHTYILALQWTPSIMINDSKGLKNLTKKQRPKTVLHLRTKQPLTVSLLLKISVRAHSWYRLNYELFTEIFLCNSQPICNILLKLQLCYRKLLCSNVVRVYCLSKHLKKNRTKLK